MGQLTLEQACKQYATMLFPTASGVHWESCHQDFTAGAKWQKEQYKNIKKAMQIVISCLQNAPDRNYEIETLMNVFHDMPD